MPLYTEGGVLLKAGAALAVDPDCCCDGGGGNNYIACEPCIADVIGLRIGIQGYPSLTCPTCPGITFECEETLLWGALNGTYDLMTALTPGLIFCSPTESKSFYLNVGPTLIARHRECYGLDGSLLIREAYLTRVSAAVACTNNVGNCSDQTLPHLYMMGRIAFSFNIVSYNPFFYCSGQPLVPTSVLPNTEIKTFQAVCNSGENLCSISTQQFTKCDDTSFPSDPFTVNACMSLLFP